MALRDQVVLWVNGQRREVRGSDCFLNLADYLRQRLGLVGTKVVCSEGDCGSCTVLVGRPSVGQAFLPARQTGMPAPRYQPIDSCIRFLFQLDGTHVVTVEGLSADSGLTPVQQAMVDCHGTQCGFCTPGFVMSMAALCEEQSGRPFEERAWRQGLTGNLCRCTGYTPILEAGRQVVSKDGWRLSELYPVAPLVRELGRLSADTLDLRGQCEAGERRAYCPATLEDALAFRAAHPSAKVVAGATDVGVQWNKRTIEPLLVMDLNRVSELEGVSVHEDGEGRWLLAGARATWTELLEVCQSESPEFAKIVSVFGSPQIRHVGTLGGNLINASPIADSLPFLFVMDAELELASVTGRRRVSINRFYRGYKQFDLRNDELLVSVRIPLPAPGEMLRLYKVSRRRDLDIATFTAAIRLRLEGERIAEAALAYGAVAPTVVRLPQTEAFLIGRPFDEQTLHEAGNVAVREISPISDVRGSADYRLQLARNVLLKFYHQSKPSLALAESVGD